MDIAGEGARATLKILDSRAPAAYNSTSMFAFQHRAIICGLAFFLSAISAIAQTYCAPIQSAKEKTYGFNPTKLDKEARTAKSAQMDAFWTLVKSYEADGVTCLRNLLQAEKNDGFFLFDGASLLYSMDKSDASIRVIVSSLERADLDEVDTRGYLQMLLNLSHAGVDIGPLANRYLRRQDVNAVVPEHAMELNRDMGALFIYGSLPPENADRYLIDALQYPETYARATAALLLATNMTEESFKALSGFKGLTELTPDYQKEIQASRGYMKYEAPKAPPKFTREQVLEYIRSLPHTREEVDAAFKKQREWEEKQPPPLPPAKVRTAQTDKKMVADIRERIESSPPFLEIADHERFIESAIANLGETDLPLVREARRKSLHGLSDEALGEYFAFSTVILGVINRLDLYKEYRVH
jgi:hypothetical protein